MLAFAEADIAFQPDRAASWIALGDIYARFGRFRILQRKSYFRCFFLSIENEASTDFVPSLVLVGERSVPSLVTVSADQGAAIPQAGNAVGPAR